MITTFSRAEEDRSLFLWSVNDVWGLCGCFFFFLPFSLDLNPAEYMNQEIRGVGWGCHENITIILNLTAIIVFKSSPSTKSDNFISKRMRGRSIFSRKKENFCCYEWTFLRGRSRFKENAASLRSDMSQLNSRIAAPTKLKDYDPDQNVQTNCLLLVILSL